MIFYCSISGDPIELKEKHGLDPSELLQDIETVLVSLGAEVVRARADEPPDTWNITWKFLCEFHPCPPQEDFGIIFREHKPNARLVQSSPFAAELIGQLVILKNSRET